MSEVAILGAGTMGHALALVFVLGGHRVRLTDTNEATLRRAPTLMNAALETLAEAGEVTPEQQTGVGQSVRLCPTLEETVAGADLVIEAIVEIEDVKKTLFHKLESLLGPETILASNTSQLDPFPLVPAALQRRTMITHWYTPPYLVDLVDVVGGPQTDPAVVEKVRAMLAAMGKAPIAFKKFVPGYIANRIQAAIGLEVNMLLDEGYATPRDIDDAVIHGLALRIPILGVMAKADFTGLLLMQAELAHRGYHPPPVRGKCATLDKAIAEGRTGILAGAGYFDWKGRSAEEWFRVRDRKLVALKKALRDIGSLHDERGDEA